MGAPKLTPRSQESCGPPASVKQMETAVLVGSHGEQRSIIPNGKWKGEVGRRRGGCEALVPPN